MADENRTPGSKDRAARSKRGRSGAGSTSQDQGDETLFRPGGPAEEEVDDSDPTEIGTGPGRSSGADDATEFRAPLDDEVTEVNSLTRALPATGRTLLGAAGSLSPDDDATVRASHSRLADDDATVRASQSRSAGDDATVRAVSQSRLGDDDATVQSGASRGPSEPAGSQPQPQAIGPGRVLKGRFALESKLGAGGMGGVFKAVDLVKQEAQDRNPYVAVKILNEAFAGHADSFLALQRESSRSQRLTHPNVAAVYDFDRDGEGGSKTAYMVMELLEGAPLDIYLKQNGQGLDPVEARLIIRHISEALAYAHGQKPALVHSDFKPGNIFWTNDSVAKVFDFGIARAATASSDDVIRNQGGPISELQSDESGDHTLFDAGKLGALTPAYATIEMLKGLDPAPQDDVYALGIVAYQCFTGKHPFNRKRADLAAELQLQPERPAGVTSREWRALRRSLEFKREDRTPDAQAFLDEFFFAGSRTPLFVATTAAAMAVGVGLLYVTGVIGPEAPKADPNEDWLALESETLVPRNAVTDLLNNASFTTNDEFVAWEGLIRRNIQDWEKTSGPSLVLEETFSSQDAAISAQDRTFQLSEGTVSMAVEGPDSAGLWFLQAGPFRFRSRQEADEAVLAGDMRYAERMTVREFAARLEDLNLDYSVRSDAAAIDEARASSLDVYLDEFERRLPDQRLLEVRPVLRKGEQYLRDIDPNPENEETKAHLDEGGFWVVDPQAQTEIASVQARIRAAGMDLDESDRLRGPSVLARAERDFPVRPADIAAARRRAAALYGTWGRSIQEAQTLASRYQSRYVTLIRTLQEQQARIAEREAVADARRVGNEGDPITLAYTLDEFSEQLDEGRVRNQTTDDNGNPILLVEFPGVYQVFSRECNAPARVDFALVDFRYLTEPEQQQALRYLADCMVAKVERNTEEVLESKQLVLAAVDHEAIRLIERPDPCGAFGYVGAGRNAFCRDTWVNGAAPPVVIIDGPGVAANYGISKYEVSVAEYNAFAGSTDRNLLDASSGRLPATGVALEDARAYAVWLSEQTGRTYRLPTVAEWRHAAGAGGGAVDANRNCYSNVRGVIRGETLVNVGQGAPNAWGLVNHVGNAEEWATEDEGVLLLGGRHTDQIAECSVSTSRPDDGSPDAGKGFRLLRQIDSIQRIGVTLASARE